MKLIVGLGNTGSRYQMSRHNIGFMVVDSLGESSWRRSEFSLIQKMKKSETLLVKPQTQMNLSGRAVQYLLSYYKVENQDLLVIHDDIDLNFLQMKIQRGRGHGGHNGVRNIHELLGHPDYYRLRLGVGKRLAQGSADASGEISRTQKIREVSKYVLSPFGAEELSALKEFLVQSVEAVECFISKGGEAVGNSFNQKRSL